MTEHRTGRAKKPIAAVVRALNEAYGADWSFDIVGHELLGERVEVTGELRGNGVSAREKGRAERTPGAPGRSIGELLEAASDESLRRCAALLLDGTVDAFALNRTRMEALARDFPAVRVLDDNFLVTSQAVVVAQGGGDPGRGGRSRPVV